VVNKQFACFSTCEGSGPYRILLSLVDYKLAGPPKLSNGPPNFSRRVEHPITWKPGYISVNKSHIKSEINKQCTNGITKLDRWTKKLPSSFCAYGLTPNAQCHRGCLSECKTVSVAQWLSTGFSRGRPGSDITAGPPLKVLKVTEE